MNLEVTLFKPTQAAMGFKTPIASLGLIQLITPRDAMRCNEIKGITK